jgi:hypothetical protein
MSEDTIGLLSVIGLMVVSMLFIVIKDRLRR